MAKYTRIEVAQLMMEQGMVPLFYHADVELGKEVLRACYQGGARLLEFTNRGDFAHTVFEALNRFALAELPGMVLGVGSVTDAGTASLYLQLGAHFVVTPVLREDVGWVCNRRKVLWSPGCASLSEIARAEEMGAEIVKLFPGGTYGPGFIQAIAGPQPWTRIMPTGGVSPDRENLSRWFSAGAACVGMGSQLISRDLLQNRDMAALEARVRDTLELIRNLRGN
jgi:2-dehydro-3-deoxyphosphogluconate aldolase/(4S)-4-hydroxy-2-oxoglutarate aldolase